MEGKSFFEEEPFWWRESVDWGERERQTDLHFCVRCIASKEHVSSKVVGGERK